MLHNVSGTLSYWARTLFTLLCKRFVNFFSQNIFQKLSLSWYFCLTTAFIIDICNALEVLWSTLTLQGQESTGGLYRPIVISSHLEMHWKYIEVHWHCRAIRVQEGHGNIKPKQTKIAKLTRTRWQHKCMRLWCLPNATWLNWLSLFSFVWHWDAHCAHCKKLYTQSILKWYVDRSKTNN